MHWWCWDRSGTLNRTSATNTFFPFQELSSSTSSATGASEQLLELLLELLLLEELPAGGAFCAASGMGAGPKRPCTWGTTYSKSRFLLALGKWTQGRLGYNSFQFEAMFNSSILRAGNKEFWLQLFAMRANRDGCIFHRKKASRQ